MKLMMMFLIFLKIYILLNGNVSDSTIEIEHLVLNVLNLIKFLNIESELI